MRHLRSILGALLALPLALSTVGCDETSNTNTLTLWHAWGGAELSALNTLIGQYKAQHPGVEIMALQVPYDKLKDKFLRSAAANGGPDMVIGDADWSGKFAASDLLVPTTQLFTPAELSRFLPGAIASLRLGDKMYAIPESRETIALYYNKKLLPTPPATLSEFYKDAAAVQNVQYGAVYQATFYYSMGYFFGAGGRLFDDHDKLAINSPGGIAALNLLEQMSRAKGVLTSPEYNKSDSLYKQAQTAMIVNGPWALVDYQKALGKDLGVAMLPKLDDGHPAASWVGVKCMMFNQNADNGHRKLAHDFALFMTTPESQKILSEKAGHIPSVKGVKLDPSSPLSVFQAQADVGTPVSIKPEVSLVWEPMDKAVKEVTEHVAAPQAALSEAERVINGKLQALGGH